VTYNFAVKYMNSKKFSRLVMKYVYRSSIFIIIYLYLTLWPVAHKEIGHEKLMNKTGSKLNKLLVVAT
jgi:hypothetical protein